MVKIIAEIGWNHMGDMELAKRMAYEAKDNGADIVKTQTFDVSRLKAGPWDTDGRREIYEKAQLSLEQHIELRDYCNDIEVQFMSSVFSIDDAKLLEQVETDMVKIPSMESRNKELIDFCTNSFDKLIVSTGTSTWNEIRANTAKVNESNPYSRNKDTKLVLLHCVSSYPLEYTNANLPKINSLKKLCDRVGYSDHTFGVEGSKLALEYDIEVIEKHFTIDHDLPGRDNKFAILPHELKKLSDYIKLREDMNVDHGDGYLECEEESREIMTGRFENK